MRKDILKKTAVILFAATLLGGCDTALSLGGRTLGIQSGKFVYIDNSLKRHYNFPIDQVSTACEKALRDLNGTIIEKQAAISAVSWTANLHEDKVRISVEYVTKDRTLASVQVGLSSNNTAALLIHQRIENNLPKP
jgi:hypothetical protein